MFISSLLNGRLTPPTGHWILLARYTHTHAGKSWCALFLTDARAIADEKLRVWVYCCLEKVSPGRHRSHSCFVRPHSRLDEEFLTLTSASLFSLLPPSTTIRIYHRIGQATAVSELGNILCSILSLASSHDKAQQPQLVKNLILIRSKLKRSKAQAQFASYEFSLRGKWPAERYNKIFDLQV